MSLQKEVIDQNKKLIEELRAWKEAVIDELIVRHLYCDVYENNPKKALNAISQWDMDISEYFTREKVKNEQDSISGL